jgi:regulator of protease activity HflC (stomatin/prohibitin superfamily)
MSSVIIIALIVFAVLVLASCVKIVPQSEHYVIERLGVYGTTWREGLHIKIPVVERVAAKVSVKEQVVDFAPQPVITRDNVSVMIDTVVYYLITDARMYAYGVNDPVSAIENLTATTLRSLVGAMELDETLTSRERINTELRKQLDDATDPWGIKINRVELKSINPPKDILEAMQLQMRSERERRAAETEALGYKKSITTRAEGDKDAAILAAQAEKQVKVLAAVGESEAARVLIATFGGIDRLLQMRALETLSNIGGSAGNTVVIPAELSGLLGAIKSVSTVLPDKNPRTTDNPQS